MNKLIKVGSSVTVILDSGVTITKCITADEYDELIKNLQNNEFINTLFFPEYKAKIEDRNRIKSIIDRVESSKILIKNGDSVIWPEVSPLSMPKDLIISVLDAIDDNNTKALNAYKNFWILLSLNPSDECRKNLLWFLNIHGLQLCSSGCFIAYRNADRTNRKDDEGNPIYTDRHSGTTAISIGHTVTLDRSKCDENNQVMCSRGLHAGGAKWLEKNYFGDTGFVVLINPVNVVSLPQESCYGKLRCCAYTPIDYARYDENGHIVPYDVEQGFDCKYAAQTVYEGLLQYEEEGSKYTIKIPVVDSIEIKKEEITENLLNLARECITNKSYEYK